MTDSVSVGYLDSTVVSPVRVNEADIERLAALVGLPISPADRPAAAVALGVLLTAGELVSEYPLADDLEAAPVFHP